jgi:hypothetical protein
LELDGFDFIQFLPAGKGETTTKMEFPDQDLGAG